MPITFITGANKGLGYETARRLVALGHVLEKMKALMSEARPERGAGVREPFVQQLG